VGFTSSGLGPHQYSWFAGSTCKDHTKWYT